VNQASRYLDKDCVQFLTIAFYLILKKNSVFGTKSNIETSISLEPDVVNL